MLVKIFQYNSYRFLTYSFEYPSTTHPLDPHGNVEEYPRECLRHPSEVYRNILRKTNRCLYIYIYIYMCIDAEGHPLAAHGNVEEHPQECLTNRWENNTLESI